MTKIYNTEKYKIFRKSLRNNMPAPEQRIWYYIRSKRLGYKFRRQYSFGCYIVDFYCPDFRLAIEIDGDSHGTEDGIIRDNTRNIYLKNLNILIKRYTNNDVMKNIEGVMEDLENFIVSISTPSTSPLVRGRTESPFSSPFSPCQRGSERGWERGGEEGSILPLI